jgi:hypothetical protein
MQLHIRRNKSRCSGFFSSPLVYRLEMILLLDEAERRVVNDNGWWGKQLYQSQAMFDRIDEHDAIAAQPVLPSAPDRFWQANQFERWVWKQARLAGKRYQINNAHRITVGDLARGVTLSGSLDDITTTEAILTEGATILDAKVNSSRSFDDGAVIMPVGRAPAPPSPRNVRRLA